MTNRIEMLAVSSTSKPRRADEVKARALNFADQIAQHVDIVDQIDEQYPTTNLPAPFGIEIVVRLVEQCHAVDGDQRA